MERSRRPPTKPGGRVPAAFVFLERLRYGRLGSHLTKHCRGELHLVLGHDTVHRDRRNMASNCARFWGDAKDVLKPVFSERRHNLQALHAQRRVISRDHDMPFDTSRKQMLGGGSRYETQPCWYCHFTQQAILQ